MTVCRCVVARNSELTAHLSPSHPWKSATPIVELCPLHVAAPRLLGVLLDVLSDHDQRVALYGEKERQPNRVRVMETARAAVEALS